LTFLLELSCLQKPVRSPLVVIGFSEGRCQLCYGDLVPD
jgi:hypothetical protein